MYETLRRKSHLIVSTALLFGGIASSAAAQADSTWRAWNRPVEPFRLIGNVYYVGAAEVSSFLVTTPQGHILIDGGFAETAPQILRNVRALGFEPRDVKVIVNSHAHADHVGGLAMLKDSTGARLLAHPADAALLASGGRGDFAFGDRLTFPPVTPDGTLADGQRISLGGVTLQAHFTPGHTRGCTTWSTTVREGGRAYQALFVCSVSVPGYTLLNNAAYPTIVADYERSFRTLKGLRCDVPLGPHGSFFGLAEKRARAAQNPPRNPFVDPAGCRAWLRHAEQAFHAQLDRERRAAAK